MRAFVHHLHALNDGLYFFIHCCHDQIHAFSFLQT